MTVGRVVALRKRIRQLHWSIFSEERKGGRGMGRGILTCASLTLDKRIFQPTRVLQSNVHESTGQWRRLGVELGSEGREGDEREDEAELEGETER